MLSHDPISPVPRSAARPHTARAHAPTARAAQRRELMAPLKEPSSFCVRSFEANRRLLPLLRDSEAELATRAKSLRFVDGALGNVTAVAAPRDIVTYARGRFGSSATTFAWDDIHAGKPPVLALEHESGPSYDAMDVLAEAVRLNRAPVIALKLDVEGLESWMLNALAASPDVACSISYLFVEFHHLPNQRVNLTHYGLRSDNYEDLKTRLHAHMERPGCRLKVYWRSFWSACGDPARYMWMKSEQATGLTPEEQRAAASAKAKAKENKRMLLSKVYKHGRKKKHRRLA